VTIVDSVRDVTLDMDRFPVDLAFVCPRCAKEVVERLYGPCRECLAELGSMLSGAHRQALPAAEYEPKVNVTPNAVALKDD
jgi:hypothetical protein